MERFNLYIHGVPIGHEICGCDEELNYIKGFYNHDVKVDVGSLLQIDIVNGSSFYTYLRKKNVRNAEGRPGSYFGLTVSFYGNYCTNVQMLYEILDVIYKQICVNNILMQEQDGERFLIKQISACSYRNHPVIDYIKAAFRNNMENLRFDVMNGFANSTSETQFSLKEVDSPLFRDTLKTRRIMVSPEYVTASVAYDNLLTKVTPIKEANTQLKQANAHLTESNKKLSDEIARLEKERADSNASTSQKYQTQLDELQLQLDKCKKERNALEAKIKDATDAVDLINEPFKKLSRLLARRFQETDDTVDKKLPEILSTDRTEHRKALWIPMGSIILLFVVIAMCGFCCYSVLKLSETITSMPQSLQNGIHVVNDSTQETTKPETGRIDVESEQAPEPTSEDPNYDDYKDCYIDIFNLGPNAQLKYRETYTLSVKKKKAQGKLANVPSGTWDCSEGFTIIDNNKFRVDTTGINVQIFYNVDGKPKISREIKKEQITHE